MGHAFSSLKDHLYNKYSLNELYGRFDLIESLINKYRGDLRPLYQELDFLKERIEELNNADNTI